LAGTAQSFSLQGTIHRGYPDILTSMHGSAFESDVTRWEYDGEHYRRATCAGVEYADGDGNEYRSPHIRSERCGAK
jgi:hypothetical protein